MALFWLMAVYVVGAATISVVGQLYGNAGEQIGTDSEAACAQELMDLSKQLQTRTPTDWQASEADVEAWLTHWDNKLTALEGRCGRLETTRSRLRRVRDRVAAMQREFHAKQQPELTRITSSLEPFTASR